MKNNENIRNYSPALSYAMENNIWLCRRFSPSLLANKVNRMRHMPRTIEVKEVFKMADYYVDLEGTPYRIIVHIIRDQTDFELLSNLLSKIYEAIRCDIQTEDSYRGSEYMAVVFTKKVSE